MPGERVDVEAFNAMPADDATEVLRAACRSVFWVRVLVAGRPYSSLPEIVAASDGVIRALGWSEVASVLPEHALALDPPDGVDAADLHRYQERFGFPFVLETTGRTAERIGDDLAARFDSEVEAEQGAARRELAALVARRLLVTFR